MTGKETNFRNSGFRELRHGHTIVKNLLQAQFVRCLLYRYCLQYDTEDGTSDSETPSVLKRATLKSVNRVLSLTYAYIKCYQFLFKQTLSAFYS
jgi:hypothetical protein